MAESGKEQSNGVEICQFIPLACNKLIEGTCKADDKVILTGYEKDQTESVVC